MAQKITALAQEPQVVQIPLDNQQPDQTQILRIMEQITAQYSMEPRIRELTVSLMNGLADNDLCGQTQRCIAFVRQNVTYIRDPAGTEYLITPLRMINNWLDSGFMAGDCDDHVMLLNTMLGSIGIPAKPVGVKYGGASDFNHVISGINCCGQTWLVDPCAKNGVQPVYNETLMV